MRKKLAAKNHFRGMFQGIFVRYGTKNGYKGPIKTVLLRQIQAVGGEIVSDHLWFNFTKGFEALGVCQEDDHIEFCARVKRYEKGYNGYRDDVYCPIETDYKLSHPTQIKKIEEAVYAESLCVK